MLNLGQFNQLKVIKPLVSGAVLDGGESTRVLLTSHKAGENYQEGELVNAFIYLDSEGELAATTQQPVAQVGEVAWLRVVDVKQVGAFADWGLNKDLFIPFAEQQHPLSVGDHSLIRVYLDNQNRITGSSCIDRWVKDDAEGLAEGDKVSLIIADKTELGYKAVINHRSWGLLYANELFASVRKGETLEGYIKTIRDDQRVDLSLSKPGYSPQRIDSIGDKILAKLAAGGGRMSLNDKSPPQEIYAEFGVSKKVFKQGIGTLYKQRRISLDAEGVSLLEDGSE